MYDFVVAKSSFHSHALTALAKPDTFPPKLGAFFAGYAPVFYQRWVVPFASAVWSLRECDVGDFDVQTFLRFMLNHGFLSWSTLQWLTLSGGAREEVAAFGKYFANHGVTIATHTKAIAWNATMKELRTITNGEEKVWKADVLVLAVPAPHARDILGAHSPPELAPFQVSTSTVVLHCDASMMPRDRGTWASWNVVRGISTYWLHSIQKCRVSNQNLFVSVLTGDNVTAACASDAVWSGRMSHPMLQHGTAPLQKRLLNGLFVRGTVAFCGAWLQYGFHEDGALTGAIAARNVLGDQSIPILTPSHPLQHSAVPVWMADASTVSHTSTLSSRHSFSYPNPELAVVDLTCLPVYWWGGVFAEDHWHPDGAQLLHSIPLLVLDRAGFFPDGRISLVTTLRAFGQVMNPISLYVCWAKDRRAPQAFVLEVHNTPWNEIQCYVVDARSGVLNEQSGVFRLTNARFAKRLHVSPWHPHPDLVPQHYRATFELALSSSSSSRAIPFERLELSLKLHESSSDEKMLFSSHWTIGGLALRFPRPFAVGLQTSFRILREAVTLSVSSRSMYGNVTNPNAPISIQALAIAMILALLVSQFIPWRPNAVLSAVAVATRWPQVPLARDAWLGLLLCIVARMFC